MRRRIFAALAIAALAGAVIAIGPAPANAGHCAGYAPQVPPQVNPPQTTTSLTLSGGYYGVGGPGPLDGLGCTGGVDIADTNILLPRAEFVIVILSTKCTPGAVLAPGGSTLEGLGVKYANLSLKCGAPDNFGKTSYISDIYAIKPNLAGTITATVFHEGKKYTTTSRAAMPVDQPA